MSQSTSTSNQSSRPGLVGLRSFFERLRPPLANVVGSANQGPTGPTNSANPGKNLTQVTDIPAIWEQFWIEDYRVLFQSPTIIPTSQMSEIQRLNTLTRLIILIAIILAILRIGNWLLFLILGLVLVIILYYAQKPRENYRCPSRTHCPASQAQTQTQKRPKPRIRLRSK